MTEMNEPPLEMRFDPQTIKHLGLRMYSSLAPALAELVSNAYDADASAVVIELRESNGVPEGILVRDNGVGLSLNDIRGKFLVIGRNRRADDNDSRSPRFGRLATGKKGLGKLALFGIASIITVISAKDGLLNEFVLDWDELTSAHGSYRPRAVRINEVTERANGTEFVLSGLKRKSAFDPVALADSLSRIFIVEPDFSILVATSGGDRIAVDNARKYAALDCEFEWDLSSDLLVPAASDYAGKIRGKLMTGNKPIQPKSGLRGVTLFSRGKLVNAPEFFSSSASSHFYQYLTGWVSVDFIDLIEDDVISTNRQSIDWDHPEMAKLREFLTGVISQVNVDWRQRRKIKKSADLRGQAGIDSDAWMNTMPEDVRRNTQLIIESLGGEDALEVYVPVIKALHEIVPEYPLLHWRHLHGELRLRVKQYYEHRQFGLAAQQGAQIYCEVIRQLTGRTEDGSDLVSRIFGSKPFAPLPELQLNDLSTESLKNIQDGQGHLSRGLVVGFRNPTSHHPMDTVVPGIFSELDCLNVLSLTSYLLERLKQAKHNP